MPALSRTRCRPLRRASFEIRCSICWPSRRLTSVDNHVLTRADTMPLMARLGPAIMSAIRSLWASPATAKKPPRSGVSKVEPVAATKTLVTAGEPKVVRVTKQERVLTLLSQPEGASIEEMMQATDWQQHSVRGFLAGTVKKKLGFPLTSSKPNDGARRYRIETRRGR
jgi:Protein of unknown function (DUF3489)